MSTTQRQIKNARSQMDMTRLFARLEAVLAAHGARRITMDYDDAGRRRAVSFTIEAGGTLLDVRLPARIEQAQAVLIRQYEAGIGSLRKMGQQATSYEHAYRVAWRTILDWVEAQMALVELELVRIEEVFLPYVLAEGERTMYEVLRDRDFRALPPGGEVGWWTVLGVAPDATIREIEAAFRAKLRTMHPDAGGDHEGFLRLREAYEQGKAVRSG